MNGAIFFSALWVASGLILRKTQQPSDWVERCAQLCSIPVDGACSGNYSTVYNPELCGVWAPQNLQGGIPDWYANMLSVAKSSMDVLEQPSPADASGDIFCYGAVNSQDVTFELAQRLGHMCDEYMYFSNFSNPGLHVVKIMSGSMHVLKGGNFASALNTPVFLPIFRYVATRFSKRYKWFVKYDMDTVFRPNMLRAVLAQYDHTRAGIVSPTGLGPGGIHISSQAAMAQYAMQYKSCEDELGEFFPTEDMYFNPGMWRDGGFPVPPETWQRCNWSSESFPLPKDLQGRDLSPCEVEGAAQRSTQVAQVNAMQNETSANRERDWPCADINDIRSRLVVHNAKSRAAYAALLEIFGLG